MTFSETEDLISRYDAATTALDQAVTARLSASLDASFRNLIRELERQYPTWESEGSLFASQRRLLLLRELGGLLDVIRPQDAAQYQALLQEALQLSHTTGATLADELTRTIDPGYPLADFVTIPIEAAALQAREGVKRLYRYNEDFRTAASGIVEQGLIQGFGTKRVQSILERELGVTKSKAETLARTEVMSALNGAAQQRYQENGIEFVLWQNSPSERLCPTCAARDGNVYEVGKVSVPAHPRCLPGDAVILSPAVKAGTSREYIGEVVSLETASGKKLTATPNHPVLTDKGWIPIHLVKEGDHVFSSTDGQRIVESISPNDHQGPAPISELVAAFGEPSGVASVSVEVSPVDFHGDGGGSDVCVIRPNGLLGRDGNAQPRKVVNHQSLMGRLVRALRLLPQRLSALLFRGQRTAPCCVMCGGDLGFPLGRGHLPPLDRFSLTLSPTFNTSPRQNPSDSSPLHPHGLSYSVLTLPPNVGGNNIIPDWGIPIPKALLGLGGFDGLNLFRGSPQSPLVNLEPDVRFSQPEPPGAILDALPGKVERDCVIKSTVSHFHGDVYNLETVTGWYFANSILTHNCRCIILPTKRSWIEKDLIDSAAIAASRDRTQAEFIAGGGKLDNGPTAWERKAGLTAAPKPVWKPGEP